ncbi:MAG: hypothetical protein ABWY04_08300 [Arthrobacter sp.]
MGISTGSAESDGTSIVRPLNPVISDATAALMHRFEGNPDFWTG